jgi:hypothetical protein
MGAQPQTCAEEVTPNAVVTPRGVPVAVSQEISSQKTWPVWQAHPGEANLVFHDRSIEALGLLLSNVRRLSPLRGGDTGQFAGFCLMLRTKEFSDARL